jgi:hypothetical protein
VSAAAEATRGTSAEERTDSCAADIMRVADESYDGFILPHSSLLIFTASVSLAFKVA